MSLSRRYRLTSETRFHSVFAQPVVSTDAYFRVLARPNRGTCSRLGLAVSRKVDRRAVARNRLKRLIRQSFREDLLVRPTACADYVVLPRAAAVGLPNAVLRGRLDRHWARLAQRLAVETSAPESPVAAS